MSEKFELCFANKYSSSEPLVIHTGTLIVINIKKAISAEFCILLLNVNILRMFFFLGESRKMYSTTKLK